MDEFYYQVTIRAKAGFSDLIADYIAAQGFDGVEIQDETIRLYSQTGPHNLSLMLEELKEFIDKIDVEKKRNVDWVQKYRQSVRPLEVGNFYVHASWHEPKEGCINLIIDPALAFGSGHHATTYSCLQAIDRYVQPKTTLLDVGCGSGILGLAASKKGAVVDLCDTDEMSVQSTKENFKKNGVTYRNIWCGSAANTSEKYDVVVANIIADVITLIADELIARTKAGGFVILSGILDTKEQKVTRKFVSLEQVERIAKEEWVTLIYKKG